MHYLSYKLSAQLPNIIVDGSANAGTELLLSHWQNNTTPQELRADLSAQIVFNYLDKPEIKAEATIVSNDHFDADGLVGVYSLLNPDDAEELRDLLIDIAGAGDFNVYKNREAARISFILDAWLNPKLSPLKASIFAQDYHYLTNVLYEELLPRFPRIIEKVDYLEKYWKAQDNLLESSEEALRNKRFKLTELPELDLAIVTMPDANVEPSKAIHRMAIHNQTDCMRILLLQETNFEFYYRYESWVDFQSRKTSPRIDMKSLAESLSKQESMDGVWSFGGINEFTPALRLTGDSQSKIPFESFRSQVLEFLAQHQA
ncbi:MAG: hypothetical protein JST89_02390 [Cyanobacteria bacterium SZAS-4]|nr:hypothetical protein [Cyanobacteria bacterium SZAS-4]